jgi:CDP-4-dehydro-6-deoxyglucose reductase, E1
MNKYRFTYGGALFGKEERAAINKVLDRNWWQLEREGELMEKEASKYLGVNHGILANSGSSAALLALSALELPKDSEVIIPAVTFPTIFNIILQCGLVPVVVDAKVGTYCLDVEDVAKAITKKTKAVIAVHLLGNVVDMVALMKLAKRRKLIVLEDFCDAWGSTIDKKKIGSFGHINFTSFHAAHIIAMGQGGGVFTNNKVLAEKVRMYRDWGRQATLTAKRNTRFAKLPHDQNPRYIYEKIGYNLSPLELQAAMGRVQLKKVEKIKKLRKRNFDYLYDQLSAFPELVMPTWIQGADICWFGFPVSVKGKREALINFLEEKGIETRTMFTGNVTKHPAYVNSEYRVSGSLKDADWILEHSLWFTVHPRYTPKDLKYIVNTFKEFYDKIARSNLNSVERVKLSDKRKHCLY